MPRPARRLFAAIVLALACGAATNFVAPEPAHAVAPDAPVVVAPAQDAFVDAGPVTLGWTDVGAAQGYEISWTSEDGATGTAATTETTVEVQLDGGTYVWQVRALPGGEWSQPATFHADLQLETLALPEQPATPSSATPRTGVDAVPGGVWVLGALGFSAVFLVIVVTQSRLHREQDA